MAIIQSLARIYRVADDALLGQGQCAIHVSEGQSPGAASFSGTILVEWASDDRLGSEDDGGHRILLADGQWLDVVFTKLVHAADGPEILRFRGAGPLRRLEEQKRA